MNNSDRHKDVDKLLRGLFNEDDRLKASPLKELFEEKLEQLSITKHQACKILGIEHKTLDSFLEGDSKKIDFVSIIKISDFLEVSYNDLIDKYFDLILNTQNETVELAKKRSFIANNFDLPLLKKIGFIESINDFEDIENKINTFFGYDNIFEHSKYTINAAFSSAKRKTNKKSLEFWYAATLKSIDKTPNPYEYDREGLIEYFPTIRWHCLDVENGLLIVAQKLFKLGITLVIIPKFTQDLHIRGATFAHRGKPCIALTKYTRFYPTLWFTLIHELFHVLYDWDAIQKHKYHFTGESQTIDINENEANDFARQYLFSNEKLEAIIPHIDEPHYVERFAEQNHVNPSFVYVFYLWGKENDKLYAKYNKYLSVPNYDKLLDNFNINDYLKWEPVKDVSRKRNINLNYNTL